MKNIQTQPKLELLVLRDGELDPELNPRTPSIVETAMSHVRGAVGSFACEIALQAKLAVFDVTHRSNLRQTRNELLRVKKIEAQAAAIGLVAVKR